MKMIFATSNAHKLSELKKIVGEESTILGLRDIGWTQEIEETEDTLEGNAILKARTIADELETNCFSEDTGLEIKALGGQPGVRTARYAGTHGDSQANMAKVLEALEVSDDRSAQFRTVMALVIDDAVHCFEGVVTGKIAESTSGEGGFGYDPIFIPDGYDKTFAELPSEVKSQISHRAVATNKLVEFLNSYTKCKSQVSR